MSRHAHQAYYSNTRIALHWLSAIVIIWACITGFWASFFPKQSAIRHFFDIVNPQLTAVFIPFFGWRVALYLSSRPWREWPRAMAQERLALIVHGLLYVTIMTVLLTGLLMMPSPWALLGVFPIFTLDIFHNQLFFIHKISCVGLVGLIGLHLTGVLYHLRQKRPILNKMRLSSKNI